MSNATDSARNNLTIRPLGAALGAEVTGIDLAGPLDDDTLAAVQRAWMEHLVLVFPNQPLSDAQHISFAKRFGALEEHHQEIIKSRAAPEIFSVSNVDDDGNLMAPDHPSVAQISLAQRWHSDSSFRPVPSLGSILHGIEVTEDGVIEWEYTQPFALLMAAHGVSGPIVDGVSSASRHDVIDGARRNRAKAPCKKKDPSWLARVFPTLCSKEARLAEGKGFEPLVTRSATTAFEAAPFVRSGNLPATRLAVNRRLAAADQRLSGALRRNPSVGKRTLRFARRAGSRTRG